MPIPNYDDTLLGKYIRAIENSDSTYQTYNLSDNIENENLYSDNTDLEEVIFFNKTEYLLYCHRNNYLLLLLLLF